MNMEIVYFTIPLLLLGLCGSTNFVIAQTMSQEDSSSTGIIPFPYSLKNMTMHFCNTMLGSNMIDPQVLNFVIANNPKAINLDNNPEAQKSLISKQFWEILERKLITSSSKFVSLNGTENSIVFPRQNQTSNLMCPGTWGLNGTFKANNGPKYDFEFSANDYNFKFIPNVQSPFLGSPLKQFKSGIAAMDVTCSQNLILIIKSEDGFPACVKLDHTSRFFSQGWIPATINKTTIDGLQDAYQVGEKIDFTTYFEGFVTRCDYPHVVIQDSNQKTIWSSNYIVQLCDPATGDHPVYVKQQYNLSSGLGGPISINQTGDYAAKISFYDQSVSKNFTIFSISNH